MANADTSINLQTADEFKVALITGGTKGIGFAIAKSLAESGHHLVLGYNSDHETADQANKTIRNKYGKIVVCVNGDTKDDETVERYFEVVKKHFQNHVTVLIHNAGGYPSFNESPRVDSGGDVAYWLKWSETYYKMYASCFGHLVQKALGCTGLKHIIAISSPGCNLNDHPREMYELMGIGKSAMEFLVRVNAKKLGPKGITVNCVIPGVIPTEPWKGMAKIVLHKADIKDVSDEEVENVCKDVAEKYSLKRTGKPEDVANVVAFFCSEKGSFITGVCLPVDGGLHLGALLPGGRYFPE